MKGEKYLLGAPTLLLTLALDPQAILFTSHFTHGKAEGQSRVLTPGKVQVS